MFRLQDGKGNFIGQWGTRSEFDTAMTASLTDYPKAKKANVRDDNNFDYVDDKGKVIYTVTGPRPDPETDDPAPVERSDIGGEA